MQFGAALASPTLKLAQVTPRMVHLVLEMTVQSMSAGQSPVQQMKQADIVVEFHDGLARGNAQFGPMDSFLVAMVPSQVETIQELHPQTLPEAMVLNAAKNEDKDVFLNKAESFVKSHPDSPLSMEIYPILFTTAHERKLDKGAVDALADQYVKTAQTWGARAALGPRRHRLGAHQEQLPSADRSPSDRRRTLPIDRGNDPHLADGAGADEGAGHR